MFYKELKRFVAQADAAMNQKFGDYIKVYKGFKVKVSFGGGSFAKVPYISFLAPGQTTSKGIYPAYLYYRKQKRLVLAYGESEKRKPVVRWSLPTGTKTVKAYFDGDKRLGKPYRYGESYVYKGYDLTKVKVNSAFDVDLDEILAEYTTSLSSITSAASAGRVTSTTTSTSSGAPISTPKKKYPKNLILYGPPGTGKTYNSIRYAVSIINGYDVKDIPDNSYVIEGKSIKDHFNDYLKVGQIRFTTFHQSLSYEDFIEGIKPEVDSTLAVMNYPVKPGIFKQMCDDARGETENFVLIIDEINRGNVAQIFGELITLIEEDKREGEENTIPVTLPYSSSFDPKSPKFTVPSNLYILGTMNTADRSVEALDSALRRRFSFVEMRPDAEKIPDTISGSKISPREILKKINSRLEVLKDTEHQIGHSYFMGVDSVEKLMGVFRYKIIPLLQEYFFGDVERIKMIIGDGFFVTQKNIKSTLFPNYKGDVDFPEELLQIWDDVKWTNCVNDKTHTAFLTAIDTLMQ